MTKQKKHRNCGDHLSSKQRDIVDKLWSAFARKEDPGVTISRIASDFGTTPETVVYLLLVDEQVKLAEQGRPVFVNAEGEPVIRLPG